MKKFIDLLNRFLNKFGLELVNKKEITITSSYPSDTVEGECFDSWYQRTITTDRVRITVPKDVFSNQVFGIAVYDDDWWFTNHIQEFVQHPLKSYTSDSVVWVVRMKGGDYEYIKLLHRIKQVNGTLEVLEEDK